MRGQRATSRLIERASSVIDEIQSEESLALKAKATRRIGSNPLIDRINAQRGAHEPPTHDELVAYVEWLKRSG